MTDRDSSAPIDPRTRDADDRAQARQLIKQCRDNPNDASLWLRTALLLDSLDREATAVSYYEHALKLGLSAKDQRTALICLASSHRNLRHTQQALTVMERARRKFPDDPAVESFYALALLDAGQAKKAIRVLGLTLVSAAPKQLDGFDDALRMKFRGVTARSIPPLTA